MTLIIVGFDWDAGNRLKCQKHGMSIEQIEEVLTGGPYVSPDPGHSQSEARSVAVGRTLAGRAAFVVFTLRGGLIRPLSARFMHAKEAERYEASGTNLRQ